MDALNQLRRGKLVWNEGNADPLWACTGCRQCTTYCEHDNEPGLVLFAGRAQANAHGSAHPKLANYTSRFRDREERLADRVKTAFADRTSSAEATVGFWPGCDAIDKGRADVDAALSLFDRMGEDIGIIESEQVCGGYPLLAAGYPDMFRWHAARVARSLKQFKTVITNCSACLFTMRKQYRGEDIELSAEIVSVSEFLAERLAKLPKATTKKPIYYHDPCQLARYSGVIDEPRLVLSRIGEVRDFSWSHSDTECCGGAGLLPKTAPDTADAMARRRLREISQRGGGIVVTACATCTYMLKSNAPSGVEVYDLATYVAQTCRTIDGEAERPAERRP